jgi:hypothetical protein
MDDGAMTPLAEMVEQVTSAPIPTRNPVPSGR